MRRNTIKLVSIILVMALVLGIGSVASAAYTMYAKQDTTVRSGPGSNYASIGTLDKGDSIIATGNSTNGWAQVRYSEYEQGYVQSAHLTYYQTTNSSGSGYVGKKPVFEACPDCGDIYYATTALNVRSGPGTNYSIIGSLARNQRVTRIGKSGDWYKLLTSNGTTAYASASYLKKVSSGSSSGSSSNNYVSYGTYYTTTGLNVRKGPGTGYSVIDTLKKGAAVTYLGDKDGKWLKVRTNSGLVGWCHGSYLTTKSVGTVTGSGSVCVPSSFCGYCGRLYYGSSCTYCNNGGNFCWGPVYDGWYVQIGRKYDVDGTATLYNVYDGDTVKLEDGTEVRVIGVPASNKMLTVTVLDGKHKGKSGLIYIYDLDC